MIRLINKSWWKYLGIILVYYTIIAGFLVHAPRLAILHESIRNLFFHVSIWFAMVILLIISVTYSIKYLINPKAIFDNMASEFAKTGIVFGLIGVVTGSIWARFTWGSWWVNDPKLNATTIALLIYLAYLVLRLSMENEDQRARISAVYNIFAFTAMIPLIFILPRLTDSLHPGSGGNPGFNVYDDVDNNLRKVFYPSIIAWTIMGFWLTSIRIRIKNVKEKIFELESKNLF